MLILHKLDSTAPAFAMLPLISRMLVIQDKVMPPPLSLLLLSLYISPRFDEVKLSYTRFHAVG